MLDNATIIFDVTFDEMFAVLMKTTCRVDICRFVSSNLCQIKNVSWQPQ